MPADTCALKKLREVLPFHQLRWYCFKKSRGTVFHVATTNNTAGQQVLDYFLENHDKMATACESFTRFPDDNLTVSQLCHKWGNKGADSDGNRWGTHKNPGNMRIYRNVCKFIDKGVLYSCYHAQFPFSLFCDDYTKGRDSISPGDTWELYAR